MPLADFANHSPSSTAFLDYDKARGAVVLRASQDYQEGQQVMAWYGPKSSTQLLLAYGYLPPEDELNPHESVPVSRPR